MVWLHGDEMLRTLEAARAFLIPTDLDTAGLATLFVAAQLALLLLLLCYALALRVRRRVLARHRNRMYNVWHYLVPAFLSGEIDEEYLHHSLRARDYPLFAEFLRPYLVDLAGSDDERLAALLRRLGLTAYLRRGLRHRSPWRRAHAVHFFGLIGDPGSRRLIRASLDDEAEIVVIQAAQALMRLQDVESIDSVVRRFSRMPQASREQIEVYLLEFGVRILPALQSMVHEAKAPAWLLITAVQVLSYHHYMLAIWDFLYLYLNTHDRDLSIACARALAVSNEPTLVGFFERMLEDPDPVLRAEAARAIGSMGNASHARMLARLLVSDDFWVVKHSVDALMRLDMLPWVLQHDGYGRDHFSARAWSLIREAHSEQELRKRSGSAA